MPSAQLVALTALCVHYSSLTILMHLSRTRQAESNYRASSAVVMTELFKLIISIVFAINRLVVLLRSKPSGLVHEASPNARFHPQFESLPEMDEGAEDEAQEPFHARIHHELDQVPSDSKWNEDSVRLTSDPSSRNQTSSGGAHQRAMSSESYIANQSGKRKRLISGHLSPNMNTETVDTSNHNRLSWDHHSHRMSVEASPRLVHPSNRTKSPIHLVYLILEAFPHLRASVFGQGWWLLGIPAVMFVTQNNLQYLAASNLSVPLFQITYQLKILTTALCSVFLLKRSLKRTQWVSLLILTAGVAIVQSSSQPSKTRVQPTTLRSEGVSRRPEIEVHTMNQPLGLMAVVAACLSSGFASVYLERMFKSTSSNRSNHVDPSKQNLKPSSSSSGAILAHKNTLLPSSSIWIKNIQLSSFGLIFSLLIVLLEDQFENPMQFLSGWLPSTFSSSWSTFATSDRRIYPSQTTIKDLLLLKNFKIHHHFFIGFSNLTWLVILFQVLGGILNSFVMKFSNNINKNFSICLSIILSIFLSKLFLSSSFDHHLDHQQPNIFNSQFFVGSFLVFFSTWLFNL